MLVMLEYLAYESHKKFHGDFCTIDSHRHHRWTVSWSPSWTKKGLGGQQECHTGQLWECCGTRPHGWWSKHSSSTSWRPRSRILSSRVLLRVWVVRTSILFWKQKMMLWLNALLSGSACTTRRFSRRSWKRLSNKRPKEEEEEEVEVEVEEEQKEPQEPTVPPPTTVSMECQTDDSFLSETEAGSSSQKEEPVPPEASGQTEVSGEQQTDIQKDDTAPKPGTAKRLYYGADITGKWGWFSFSKTFQVFFWWLSWWMGRLLQSRLPSFFSTSTYVLACKVQEDYGTSSRSLVYQYRWSVDGRIHCQA